MCGCAGEFAASAFGEATVGNGTTAPAGFCCVGPASDREAVSSTGTNGAAVEDFAELAAVDAASSAEPENQCWEAEFCSELQLFVAAVETGAAPDATNAWFSVEANLRPPVVSASAAACSAKGNDNGGAPERLPLAVTLEKVIAASAEGAKVGALGCNSSVVSVSADLPGGEKG